MGLTVLCIIICLTSTWFDWNGSKVLQEFASKGMLKFVFQYIYYLFEVMLFMLIIVYGQKACEVWFKRTNIPYGGIVVALTWGWPIGGRRALFLPEFIQLLADFALEPCIFC